MRVLIAPDKFRGTATAIEVAAAIAEGVRAVSPSASLRQVPLSDGGEGFVEVMGGANRCTQVEGPLGQVVDARWRLKSRTAVIEMAQASGLSLAGGAELNDPLEASTRGTGQLIAEALDSGARRIIVGHGGSASTDGGLPAVKALFPTARLRGVELVAAVDVGCMFVDAAAEFGPQKGATPNQVSLLTRRLERVAQIYLEDFGVDVTAIEGAGAAGGLAGGLAAVGATVTSGFEVIAEELDLAEMVERSDLVITGEGFLDETSFDGKVVGGVVELAAEFDVEVLAIAGEVFDGVDGRVQTVSLVERFGRERSMTHTTDAISKAAQQAVESWLTSN